MTTKDNIYAATKFYWCRLCNEKFQCCDTDTDEHDFCAICTEALLQKGLNLLPIAYRLVRRFEEIEKRISLLETPEY